MAYQDVRPPTVSYSSPVYSFSQAGRGGRGKEQLKNGPIGNTVPGYRKNLQHIFISTDSLGPQIKCSLFCYLNCIV